MSKASSLAAKINKVLTQVNPITGTVFKRVLTRSGGDPVTGKGVTVTTTDTSFSVPASLRQATYNNSSLNGSKDSVKLVGTATANVVDYVMTVSATDITSSDLTNPDLTIVIVDGDYEEEFYITGSAPGIIYGEVVVNNILVRSKKRAHTS